MNPRLATALTAVKPFSTMHAFHRSLFRDERLVQALDRYATYVGSSPYQVPATFTMIAHLEFNDGVYYVRGGNTEIAKRLEACAKNNGVSFHYGEEAASLRTHEKKITEVITQTDQSYTCDHVILNGDLLTQTSTLLKTPPPTDQSFTPSSSAFVMMLRNDQPQKKLATSSSSVLRR
ncbi:methoxyneurosporene dehydrogenase [Geomicrobium sp. JCM 19055]|nr:FAD-dependent oxidoreductase [Geomicrobium sp. JCM 19055]GAJ98662.1 methoxyneurosporene dehydrogenase [Geomicrobium sp. JCM 19055]